MLFWKALNKTQVFLGLPKVSFKSNSYHSQLLGLHCLRYVDVMSCNGSGQCWLIKECSLQLVNQSTMFQLFILSHYMLLQWKPTKIKRITWTKIYLVLRAIVNLEFSSMECAKALACVKVIMLQYIYFPGKNTFIISQNESCNWMYCKSIRFYGALIFVDFVMWLSQITNSGVNKNI